jgi:hypothetical protein
MIRRWAGPLHLFILALWLGLILAIGASAAVIFPAIKSLDPSIPDYAAYTGEHWLLLAGVPASRLFAGLDGLSVAALFLAVLTAFLMQRESEKMWVLVARWALLALLAAAVIYQTSVFHPKMFGELTKYWDAAKLGDNTLANTHRDAFRALHPDSTTLLATVAALITFLAILTMSAMARKPEPEDRASRPVMTVSVTPKKPAAITPRIPEQPQSSAESGTGVRPASGSGGTGVPPVLNGPAHQYSPDAPATDNAVAPPPTRTGAAP